MDMNDTRELKLKMFGFILFFLINTIYKRFIIFWTNKDIYDQYD